MNENEEEKLCKNCGFPDLDGLWYDGLCESCHEQVATASVIYALRRLQQEQEEEK
jgi:hypothetical protein